MFRVTSIWCVVLCAVLLTVRVLTMCLVACTLVATFRFAVAQSKMPIVYALVARQKCVLAECTMKGANGNFFNITRVLLSRIKKHNTKMSLVCDKYARRCCLAARVCMCVCARLLCACV